MYWLDQQDKSASPLPQHKIYSFLHYLFPLQKGRALGLKFQLGKRVLYKCLNRIVYWNGKFQKSIGFISFADANPINCVEITTTIVSDKKIAAIVAPHCWADCSPGLIAVQDCIKQLEVPINFNNIHRIKQPPHILSFIHQFLICLSFQFFDRKFKL